ncbi:MAG: phage holin family protein [SAR202 cluster bacterium]|nr:phage holin family protein [SAR202 cluster bacterium]
MQGRSAAVTFALWWLITSLSVWAAAVLVPGIAIGEVPSIAVVGLVFGLVNRFVKPVLALLAAPLILLTLGLFLFVINALLLLFVEWIAGRIDAVDFTVNGFWAALFGSIVISIVSWLLSALTGLRR